MYQFTNVTRHLSRRAQGPIQQWSNVSPALLTSLIRHKVRNSLPRNAHEQFSPNIQACRLFSVEAPKKTVKLEVAQVQSLFHVWNNALNTLDPATVTKLYSKRPYLLPTISNIPRTDVASIMEYFEVFLKLKPQGVVTESFVTTGENYCSDCGLYEFTLRSDGTKVKARFTFIYVYEDGEWKIAHHHSSGMPEKDV